MKFRNYLLLKEGVMSSITSADHLAARLLVYTSLDYSARNDIDEKLLGEEDGVDKKATVFLEKLAGLSDEQYAYMIRKALTGRSDSKQPMGAAGECLLQVAAGAGIDTERIQKAQEEKADSRAEKVKGRIAALKKIISKQKK